ncbi:MAG: sigma-70 family RNA polymerase sigma factor [Myxococcota bacterium]
MMQNVGQLEQHRSALTGHCYRMLGSLTDADDAVQETMVRAWRKYESFDGRSSLRTWLCRIATNVCLDAISDRKRLRTRPVEEGPAGTVNDELVTHERSHWLEPIPDARVLPEDASPSELLMLRQSIRLAFVAALQYLPAKQRAVLLMMEVLGCSAAEVSESLDISVAAVNSALQRARAALEERKLGEALREPRELTGEQSVLLERYLDAFHRFDVGALTSLLSEDAKFCMPPYTLWLQGPAAVKDWMLGRGCGCRGSRLIPTAASGSPAFGQYRVNDAGEYYPHALIVLELAGDRIVGWTSFLDTETLFPRFGLPPVPPV